MAKPPKLLKRKGSIVQQTIVTERKLSPPAQIPNKEDLNLGQGATAGPFPLGTNAKPGISTICVDDEEVEVLDLVADESNPYPMQKKGAGNLEKLEFLCPKSSPTHSQNLPKRPFYAYLNKEVPGPLSVEPGRSWLRGNGGPSYSPSISGNNLENICLLPDTSTDYDDIEIDSFLADISVDIPAVPDTPTERCQDGLADGLSIVSPSTPPGLVAGSLGHMENCIENRLGFESFGVNCRYSSSATVASEDKEVEAEESFQGATILPCQ